MGWVSARGLPPSLDAAPSIPQPTKVVGKARHCGGLCTWLGHASLSPLGQEQALTECMTPGCRPAPHYDERSQKKLSPLSTHSPCHPLSCLLSLAPGCLCSL